MADTSSVDVARLQKHTRVPWGGGGEEEDDSGFSLRCLTSPSFVFSSFIVTFLPRKFDSVRVFKTAQNSLLRRKSIFLILKFLLTLLFCTQHFLRINIYAHLFLNINMQSISLITKYIYFMFYKSIYDINIEIKFTILAKQRNI